jgi:hypothetical protein
MTSFVKYLSLLMFSLAFSVTCPAAPTPILGGLDCNGWSPISTNVKPLACTDLHGANGARFYDNGWYIGHDEPSVQFFSSRPNSGNNMVWSITLPQRDPIPTQDGKSVASWELTPAIWFSLAMCDPKSYPQNPCKPDSDSNSGGISDPAAAGSAVLELQLYPPGFPPFADFVSCDQTHWCAALTIDSVECNFNFNYCNPNCTEPDNFAFLQDNGVPVGPPGPGQQTLASFTPNKHTLLMNPGDHLLITIKDTPEGLLTRILDLTTGASGYMVASKRNGFANTDMNSSTCNTTPFDFHPEYSTARPENSVPWAALELNVNVAVETGHWEFADGDPDNSECTSGPPLAGCFDFSSGGDLDFDGPSYRADWPDGSKHHPTPILIGALNGTGIGPMSFISNNRSGNDDDPGDGSSGYLGAYRALQFQTDIPSSESTCDFTTGAGCVAPPIGAQFYPFYSQLGRGPDCLLAFGNVIPGRTTNDFGKDAQYGSPSTRYAGDLVSGPMPNPCTP